VVCSSISVLSPVYCAVPKGIIAVTGDVVVIFVRDLVSASLHLECFMPVISKCLSYK
jgi:hypothetical protein